GPIVGERGPHPLHDGSKAESEGHGAHRLYLVHDERPCAFGDLPGSEDDLAHGEGGVGKGNGCRVWPDIDRRSELIHVDGNGVVLDLGGNTHVAEYFPGKKPGFVGSVLLSKNRSPRAHDRKWPRRYSFTRDNKLLLRVHRKRRQRRQWLQGRLRRDRASHQEDAKQGKDSGSAMVCHRSCTPG